MPETMRRLCQGLGTLLASCLLSGLAPAQEPQLQARGAGIEPARLRAIEAEARIGLQQLRPSFPELNLKPIQIVVHADRQSLLPAQRRDLPQRVPGFALLGRNELHLVLGSMETLPPNDLVTTLRHELVHVVLDQFLGAAGPHVGRWFHEGIAQDLAEGVYLGMKEEELVPWLGSDNLPSFQVLDRAFPRVAGPRLAVAYAQSQSFFAFLRRELGLSRLLKIAGDCRADRRFAQALRLDTGKAQVYWEQRWHKYLREESGAGWRVLLRNCFSFFVIAALPLLALAMARRRNRNQRILDRMKQQEQLEDQWRAWEAAGLAEAQRLEEMEPDGEEEDPPPPHW